MTWFTDEQVEKAAEVAYYAFVNRNKPWSLLNCGDQRNWRSAARAALASVNPYEKKTQPMPKTCFICDVLFVDDDMVLPDESEGWGHACCFGPEREGYRINGRHLRPEELTPTGTRYGDLLPPSPEGEQ